MEVIGDGGRGGVGGGRVFIQFSGRRHWYQTPVLFEPAQDKDTP